MRVAQKRWGEITIKKQGVSKNHFDVTKSFSIEQSRNNYDIEQLQEVLEAVINLTEEQSFEDLIKKINRLGDRTDE